ncbi:MAG: hypothetical protein ACD_2C00014G0009 [uncultured bacterium (gcode 4)]|uniref:Uncharacterized protein n=1 Tax=uncultured bacterium (gcode 4) TaxID=1234023 RepID=K2H350_9BACT|nr:MAG: hypothetical protein ACD_2C00014G0009 [uncultured bacterium (gcode 4)]
MKNGYNNMIGYLKKEYNINNPYNFKIGWYHETIKDDDYVFESEFWTIWEL